MVRLSLVVGLGLLSIASWSHTVAASSRAALVAPAMVRVSSVVVSIAPLVEFAGFTLLMIGLTKRVLLSVLLGAGLTGLLLWALG